MRTTAKENRLSNGEIIALNPFGGVNSVLKVQTAANH